MSVKTTAKLVSSLFAEVGNCLSWQRDNGPQYTDEYLVVADGIQVGDYSEKTMVALLGLWQELRQDEYISLYYTPDELQAIAKLSSQLQNISSPGTMAVEDWFLLRNFTNPSLKGSPDVVVPVSFPGEIGPNLLGVLDKIATRYPALDAAACPWRIYGHIQDVALAYERDFTCRFEEFGLHASIAFPSRWNVAFYVDPISTYKWPSTLTFHDAKYIELVVESLRHYRGRCES